MNAVEGSTERTYTVWRGAMVFAGAFIEYNEIRWGELLRTFTNTAEMYLPQGVLERGG